MDSRKELIEATMYLLTNEVVAINSVLEQDNFIEKISPNQRMRFYGMKILIKSAIAFGKSVDPTTKNYSIMVDNTDRILDFLLNAVIDVNGIPQFDFFIHFYGYYKKIQSSLENN